MSAWMPAWSAPAAMRAVRATIVVPTLFALTFKVIGDPQMTVFAVFGAFAMLVLASFGGSRRDKAIAHLGLAVTGSVVLIIGTLASRPAWLAAVVTVPVAFAILFAGVAGPNPASGVTAALLAYVLPVASAGSASTIPARLAGWWLAAVASTAAVLLLSPRSPGDRLRASAAGLAAALGAYLDATLRGKAAPAEWEAAIAAKRDLIGLFAATPYRPTGLATADQGLANVVQLLEWCTALISDALEGHLHTREAVPADRELLSAAAAVLTGIAGVLRGDPDTALDLDRLERARAASAAHEREMPADPAGHQAAAAQAFHAQTIAVAARGAAADAMIAARRADPDTVAAERRRWYGGPDEEPAPRHRLRALTAPPALAGAAGFAARHASLRSMWFRSSARGAVALAVAVAVADVSSVQHGFWVVLGTLSVLRTNAASTESTALRALAGTVIGFVVGAALLLAIGTSATALWVALPAAVLVASYAPGTAPFLVGQAAFTVTVVVLFNLLAPAGWKVGLLRIEDVAIGCAVSLVVGVLFWPRGAAAVVGDDLADAFRRGGAYLTEAVDWALGERGRAPGTAVAAVTAGIRLDEALRGYLSEQGAKRVTKEDLWSLVMATMRLRLTAYSVAAMDGSGQRLEEHHHGGHPPYAALRRLTGELAGFYERVAVQVGRPGGREPGPPQPIAVPALDGLDGPHGVPSPDGGYHPRALWVREHLHHLGSHTRTITAPAVRLAQQRRVPWWR
jgi:Fusaric acid resistance protein-like